VIAKVRAKAQASETRGKKKAKESATASEPRFLKEFLRHG